MATRGLETVYLSGPDENNKWRAEIVNPNGSVEIVKGMGATALDRPILGDVAFRITEETRAVLEGAGSYIVIPPAEVA